jgi:hypothetical protein
LVRSVVLVHDHTDRGGRLLPPGRAAQHADRRRPPGLAARPQAVRAEIELLQMCLVGHRAGDQAHDMHHRPAAPGGKLLHLGIRAQVLRHPSFQFVHDVAHVMQLGLMGDVGRRTAGELDVPHAARRLPDATRRCAHGVPELHRED